MMLALPRPLARRLLPALVAMMALGGWSANAQAPRSSAPRAPQAPHRGSSYADRSAVFDRDAARIGGARRGAGAAARPRGLSDYYSGQRSGQYTNQSIPSTGRRSGTMGRGAMGMAAGMGMGMGMGMGGGMR